MTHRSKVPVLVWAKEYETSRPIGNATITDLDTGEHWETGRDGYAQLMIEPGRRLTLTFNKAGYPDIQTATVTVPPEGLTARDEEITFQIVNKHLEKLLLGAFGHPKAGTHYVVTTVSAKGATLHNDDGEPGVTVTLRSTDGKIVRTDGIYLSDFLGKTNWLKPFLTHRLGKLAKFRPKSTSHDGGVIFKDVPPGDYILEAKKGDLVIQNAQLRIYGGSPLGINASPPHGPRVL